MIDAVSLKILKILQEKARIPNVEVARRVGMAPSAVLERIRKLEKQGYIDGYEVRLNPQRFRRGMVGFIHLAADSGADETHLVAKLAAIDKGSGRRGRRAGQTGQGKDQVHCRRPRHPNFHSPGDHQGNGPDYHR